MCLYLLVIWYIVSFRQKKHREAHRWPHMQVTGIDISRTTINYARAQAEVQNLKNVAFEEMDIYQPLAFPGASFDLVNAPAFRCADASAVADVPARVPTHHMFCLPSCCFTTICLRNEFQG